MNLRRSEAERRFHAEIGRGIMKTRKARRISAVQLAGVLGIDHQRLYWIETGGRCSLYLAVRIAAVLDLNLAQIVPHIHADFELTRKMKDSSAANDIVY